VWCFGPYGISRGQGFYHFKSLSDHDQREAFIKREIKKRLKYFNYDEKAYLDFE
jgi:hypothetical protein